MTEQTTGNHCIRACSRRREGRTSLTIKPKQIDTVLGLLQDGNTVPFIARYRKDQTGSLGWVQIREIEERQRYLENFSENEKRLVSLIDEIQQLAHQRCMAALSKATTLTALEDLSSV